LKISEAQVAKWENKYFQMYDRWQEAESHNKSLQALEEKHKQMLVLLTNLGALLGTPTLTPAPALPSEKTLDLKADLSHPPEIKHDLFEMPSTTTIRYKQTLFD
jgi:hypothetical protein